ncbi:MAG: response regulator transcription factor [Polyangiales bacterium]
MSTSTATAHVLIVEDDAPLARLMAAALARDGLRVDTEGRGDRAVERVLSLAPDLLILDLMLPGLDGFDVLRALRPRWGGPVLMLTARGDDFDQVTGLELGADDYVIKPVVPQVLLARVRAMLRRERQATSSVLRFGALRLETGAREALGPSGPIPLTSAEYDLLAFFVQHAGRVIERDELFLALRGVPYDGLDRSLDLRVSKLRSKLREHLGGDAMIRTVHGRGYLFAVRT